MKQPILVLSVVLLALQGSAPFAQVGAQPPERCEQGTQTDGAIYLICLPEDRPWNGDLVIFAHGYVAFNEPIALPDLELPDGTLIPDLVNGLGYAFATTSYRVNGLAVLEGTEDVIDLVEVFSQLHGEPGRVYLTGGSEGGLVTALAVEQHPEVFDGGLAACGPIGDFRDQIDYWGDFRVVFDHFFPMLIPGSPVDIPDEVIENWDAIYAPAVSDAIEADPDATDQLLQVTGAPIDPKDPASVEETVLGLLWYNVFATNDGVDKLNGQPYGNRLRVYRGSDHDLLLNRTVARFSAEESALETIEKSYRTSGDLVSPLITLHTTGDPIIPYWHERAYRAKVAANGDSSFHVNIPVLRYGHCEFKNYELLVAFALLVFKSSGQELAGVRNVLPLERDWQAYASLAREYGAIR